MKTIDYMLVDVVLSLKYLLGLEMFEISDCRTFALSKIEFAGLAFVMESFTNPWGCDDNIIAEIYKDKAYSETETLGLWTFAALFAAPNSLMLDVGAYDGFFSLLAAESRPDIKTVAFEPATMTFGRLARNILWNNLDTRIVPANLAASDTLETLTFPHAWGIYTMSSGDGFAQGDPDHTQSVTAVPLDSLLEPRERRPHYLNSKSISVEPMSNVAAIKIDVEGHEPAVLRGALNLIRRFRPVIMSEFWNDAAIRAAERILAPENYVTTRIANERNLLSLPIERLADWQSSFATWRQHNNDNLNIRAKPLLTFTI